jgi:hypothetical protein
LQLGSKEQETLHQYLLGHLPAAELASFEERLMTDSAFYEELLIAEDELIDQYLRGQQSEEERESFEKHFLLTAERQKKTRFARSLRQYLAGLEPESSGEQVAAEDVSDRSTATDESTSTFDPDPSKRSLFYLFSGNPILSYSLAAALVLIVGTASWLALKNLRKPLSAQSGQVLAITLTPGLTRGDGDKASRFQIPPGISTLQLNLVLASAAHQSYRAELLTSERTSIWAGDDLQPDSASGGKSVGLTIPASLVKPDDYQIKLSGRRSDGQYEDVAGYVFRVRD